jgi:hypothetical protein
MVQQVQPVLALTVLQEQQALLELLAQMAPLAYLAQQVSAVPQA